MIDFTLFKTRIQSKLFLVILMLATLYGSANSYENGIRRNTVLKMAIPLQNHSYQSEKENSARLNQFLYRKVVSKSETNSTIRILADNDNDTSFQSIKQQNAVNGIENVLSLEIAFGQKIKAPQLGNSVTWTITGPSRTKSGLGNALKEYVFDKPGKYEINLIDNSATAKLHSKEDSCDHVKAPSKINVTVFPVRMTFIGEELKFSTDLHKGVETTGISISIPVTIETYGNQNLAFNYTTINTAGVGTNIKATLKEGTTLKAGKEILEYQLSGTAQKEAYIMFDFLDIYGKVQSVALKKPIR